MFSLTESSQYQDIVLTLPCQAQCGPQLDHGHTPHYPPSRPPPRPLQTTHSARPGGHLQRQRHQPTPGHRQHTELYRRQQPRARSPADSNLVDPSGDLGDKRDQHEHLPTDGGVEKESRGENIGNCWKSSDLQRVMIPPIRFVILSLPEHICQINVLHLAVLTNFVFIVNISHILSHTFPFAFHSIGRLSWQVLSIVV